MLNLLKVKDVKLMKWDIQMYIATEQSSRGVWKWCSENMQEIYEHPRWSAISIELQSNFIEITLQHGCSPVTLLHIFRTPFHKKTSGRLLLLVHFFPTI